MPEEPPSPATRIRREILRDSKLRRIERSELLHERLQNAEEISLRVGAVDVRSDPGDFAWFVDGLPARRSNLSHCFLKRRDTDRVYHSL